MVLSPPSLDSLDSSLVQQQLEEIRAQVQERFPEFDLKRGVLHDLLLYAHALLTASERTLLSQYLDARSLQQIALNPTLAEEELVDDVLSNWGVTRQPGSNAIGPVAVVLSDNTSVTIGRGVTFQANGKEFVTTSVFTAKTDEELINNSTDRLLTQLSDGNWAFTIEVEAVETGAASRLPKNTLILPLAQPTNFVTSYVSSDFTGGDDVETNDALLDRLQQGLAAKALSNRVNMNATLRDQPEFSRYVSSSIVGYGDPEMLRDSRSLFPIHYGGRVDWYLRTQSSLHRTTLTKTAVLIEKTSDGYGIWQLALTKQDAPGFYEVSQIRLPEAENVFGGFEIVEEERGLDLTNEDWAPDVTTVAESAYTAYQTTILRFKDTVTETASLTAGDRQDYELEAAGLPLIREIQDYVAGRDVRHYGADALVKAPVPCLVQITCTIHKQAEEPDPDIEAIKLACQEVVHAVGFIGRLHASAIYSAIHQFLTNATTVSEMDLFGRIRRPDGAFVYLRDREVLTVPEDPANMVTAKTVQFFTEPDVISINIETDVPTPH